MATTLADNYYLKALEEYPWAFSEVVENLNYALSYDQDHPGANCLMARLQMDHLMQFKAAEEYFQRALSFDPYYGCAYQGLIELYIKLRRYTSAQKVLIHAQKVPEINRSFILKSMALILEGRGSFKLAKHNIKAALSEAMSSSEKDNLQEAMDRLKAKIKLRKKRSSYD